MIPLRLVLENFISHVKSELDFTKFDAALLIGAHSGNPYVSNGVGKSAIFDGMRWALTNKSRFSTKDKVVKRGKALCKVIFEFKIEDEEYRIVRTLNKRSNITDVSFYKKVNGKWEDDGLTCDTPTMTNKKIIEVVNMSDDTFVNSVYFKQNDISGFASATTTKRKEILKEVLQIGIWDDYQQIAKDNVKRYESQRDHLEERLKIIGDVELQRQENAEKTKEMEKQVAQTEKSLRDLETSFAAQKQVVSNIETAIAQKGGFSYEKLQEEKKSVSARANEIKQKRSELQEQIKANNKVIANADNDCEALGEQIVKHAKKVAKVSRVGGKKVLEVFEKFSQEVPEAQYSQASLNKKLQELEEHRNTLNALRQDLDNLNAVKPGKECPVCLAEIENPKDIAKRRRARKKFIRSRISEEEVVVDSLSADVRREQNAITRARDSLVELERTELIMAKRMAAFSDAVHRNEIIQLELKNLGIAWQNLRAEYDKIKSVLDSVRADKDVHDELVKAKKERDRISELVENTKKSLLDLSVQHGVLKGYSEELERRNSERSVVLLQLEKVTKEIDIYKNLVKAFGKDGIQAIIMENITEDLKKYANSVLKQICSDPMTIDFVTQKQTGAGSWKEQFDIKISVGSSELDFDDLSGGEQVRISIALRLGLSQLLMRRVGSNIKFLLLDEVDQALDRHGIDALSSAILALSKNLKILVITHNEAMKEKFENIITIQKGAAGSVLKQ